MEIAQKTITINQWELKLTNRKDKEDKEDDKKEVRCSKSKSS